MSRQGRAPDPEPEAVFEEGRALPFSQLGDWVNHAGISDRAARVYWTLCEHLNAKRGDRSVWPAQSVIAKVLGIKRAADVAPAIDELVVIGAVEIRPDYDDTGRRVRNRYIIHRTPEDGYTGPRSLADFYRLLRLDDGKQYDDWFTARRKEITAGVERLKRERQEADNRAKAEAKRRALGGAGFRTSTSPAETRNVAGRVGVRDSSPRGAGFRTAEVRDPAPKQYEVEPDEDLSLPSVPKRAAAPAGAGEEREIKQPTDNPSAEAVVAAYVQAIHRPVSTATRMKLRQQAGQLLADGFPAAWIADRARELAERGWTDLAQHCDRSTVPTTRVATDSRTGWCGQCLDPNHRMFKDPARDNELVECETCHPAAIARRRRAQETGEAA